MAQKALLTPVSRANAYTLAAEQIKARILDGTWQPGDRLPPERELAAQLAISRGSTREALRILEALGCLEIKPGGGAIVREPRARADGSAHAAALPMPAAEVGDIWEARKLVEPGAAYLAAERCDEAELLAIEKNLTDAESYAQSGDQAAVFRLNPAFHLAIARASGNPIITHFQRLIAEIERKAIRSQPSDADSTPERSAKSLAEHRGIFEAIRAGRPKDAEQAAFDHLVNSWMAKWAAQNAEPS
jgi:GntR family transcriptional regulator, transcriptional repressor for pyruvate dehydrogenase complex